MAEVRDTAALLADLRAKAAALGLAMRDDRKIVQSRLTRCRRMESA